MCVFLCSYMHTKTWVQELEGNPMCWFSSFTLFETWLCSFCCSLFTTSYLVPKLPGILSLPSILPWKQFNERYIHRYLNLHEFWGPDFSPNAVWQPFYPLSHLLNPTTMFIPTKCTGLMQTFECRHVSKLKRLSLDFFLSHCRFQLLALWKIKECISEHVCE